MPSMKKRPPLGKRSKGKGGGTQIAIEGEEEDTIYNRAIEIYYAMVQSQSGIRAREGWILLERGMKNSDAIGKTLIKWDNK